ncbi:MAG: FadR family transcriptional regulator [Chloroflexi bacterium]|nr:FadR family transcriptional regulator [Chloroflexota bacterium]
MAQATEPIFHTVRVARASEDIVLQVKDHIFSGKLAPGDRLPSEKELAEQFGLSRTTVRDALRVLESQNLISIKVGAGGGAFVARPSATTISEALTDMLRMQGASSRELIEARRAIEMTTARLAAERATAEDLQAMRAAIDGAHQAQSSGDPHFTPHSVNFHVAMAKAAKNRVLLFTVSSFQTLFYETLEKIIPDEQMGARAIQDHEKLLDAIAAHDSERATRIMNEHLVYFERRVQKLEQSHS